MHRAFAFLSCTALISVLACSSSESTPEAQQGGGGAAGSGGATATGGTTGGGAGGTGGVTVTGGGAGSGGITVTGGSAGTGGITSTGGSAGTGGITVTGGSGGSGGIAGSGGVAGSGGASGSTTPDAAKDSPVVPNDGQACAIPASYTGTPFKALTIPGKIYLRDYDKGGPSVAFCRTAGATTPAACAQGIKLNDWCCTSVRCDQRGNPVCPVYRVDADNAGLSMMNAGEPDQDPAGKLISPFEAYISYTLTGEWLKFTVTVTEPGTYTITGFTAAPRPDQDPNPQVSLDFGCGITTGVFTIPPSICNVGAPCTEGYHVWLINKNLAEVTFPAAGTYLMTWTLVKSFFNPMYFEFIKK
jgi:hypothetical protein